MHKPTPLTFSIFFVILMGFILSSQVLTAQNEGVAKVIVMRGEIKAKLPSGELVEVTKGMWLDEGTVVQSAPKSFCRLLFIDKSTMNLGADSQMVIDKFPESEAGIITLMKGQVRSKVTKDYMDIKDKDKSKLFIKTKTAAMGVRGTDFQVNYNGRNTNTSLITFSGAVAMARLNEMDSSSVGIDQNRLEQIVSGREAVLVREGELSAVTKSSTRATTPQKMSRSQLQGLEKSSPDQSSTKNPESSHKPKKQFRNPVPPGMDAKKFANDSKETLKESVGKTVGVDIKTPATSREPASTEVTNSRAPAEGFHDPTTGEYAPPAGSVLDLKTVNIIEPPKGSTYDPITETYVIPPELGHVDPETGEYVPPEGMILTDDGTLKLETQASRSPAAENSGGSSSTESQGTKVNSISSDGPGDSETVQTDETIVENDTQEFERLTEETLSENEDQIEDDIEQDLIENSRGRASFEFTRTD